MVRSKNPHKHVIHLLCNNFLLVGILTVCCVPNVVGRPPFKDANGTQKSLATTQMMNCTKTNCTTTSFWKKHGYRQESYLADLVVTCNAETLAYRHTHTQTHTHNAFTHPTPFPPIETHTQFIPPMQSYADKQHILTCNEMCTQTHKHTHTNLRHIACCHTCSLPKTPRVSRAANQNQSQTLHDTAWRCKTLERCSCHDNNGQDNATRHYMTLHDTTWHYTTLRDTTCGRICPKNFQQERLREESRKNPPERDSQNPPKNQVLKFFGLFWDSEARTLSELLGTPKGPGDPVRSGAWSYSLRFTKRAQQET